MDTTITLTLVAELLKTVKSNLSMKALLIRLTVIFSIISFLTFLSFVSFASVDEGTEGEGILGLIAIVVSKLFYVL